MSLGSGFPTAWGTIRDRASRAQATADLAKLEPRHRPKAMVSTLAASERTGVAIARVLREDPTTRTACSSSTSRPRLARRRGGPPARSCRRDRGHGRRGALRDPPPRRGVPRRPEGLGFRDGKVVGAGPVPTSTMPRSSNCSPARSCSPRRARRGARRPRVRPRASTRRCSRSPISTPARRRHLAAAERGEIVGIAGLAGSGRDTVLGAAFGSLPRDAGEVEVAGKPLPLSRPMSPSAKAWRTSRRTARPAGAS